MRFLTNEEVAGVVSRSDALAAVRSAFTAWGEGQASVQDRVRTAVGDVKLSTLGAVVLDDSDPDGGVVGAKVYSTVGGRFTFLIALFAARDGRRLAVLEADTVTQLRTVATSTLAVHLLGDATSVASSCTARAPRPELMSRPWPPSSRQRRSRSSGVRPRSSPRRRCRHGAASRSCHPPTGSPASTTPTSS